MRDTQELRRPRAGKGLINAGNRRLGRGCVVMRRNLKGSTRSNKRNTYLKSQDVAWPPSFYDWRTFAAERGNKKEQKPQPTPLEA